MENIDVLCVGVACYDFYFVVDHHPQPDEKTTADAFQSCGGGPAANAAVLIAKMGLKAAFQGYLGIDALGDLHFQELEQAGVQTDWVVRGDNPTPVSTVWVKPNGERSLVNYRVRNAALGNSRVDFSKMRPKVILFDGHEPALSKDLVESARVEGIKTILDAGSVNPGTSLLYKEVDYLVCSEKFAKTMSRCTDMREAIAVLFRNNNKNVIITLGEKGLIWKTERGEGERSAFPVEAVDTTGAGDVFHGAFAGCIALSRPWHEALRYASAAAALCCTKLGGRTSIPKIEEVDAFLIARNTTFHPGFPPP